MSISHHDLDAAATALALAPAEKRAALAAELRAYAADHGVYPGQAAPLYAAMAAEQMEPMTLPAINLRGLTYDTARAAFRARAATHAGPWIFELAPVEAAIGQQTLAEYVALVLAAAVREGYRGPVFCQGDHFQITRGDPHSDADAPGGRSLLDWCAEALAAGIYQIDLDGSELSQPDAAEPRARQCANALASARLTARLRSMASDGVNLLLGAEVGEIGGQNTTPDELRGFMAEYLGALPPAMRAGAYGGIGKISVQTGTTHGGLRGPDGAALDMPVDLALARELSAVARREFGLAGCVQHGASTLSLAALARLPGAGICEAHLATGIQNAFFDHPAFPAGLRRRMEAAVLSDAGSAGAGGPETGHAAAPGADAGLTPAQRWYRSCWICWGDFKADLWQMPADARAAIGATLEHWFADVFGALRIAGQEALLGQFDWGEPV